MKPEERLTIEGVLAHPWLNCTEALDNVLPSAQMMMDKVRERSEPAERRRKDARLIVLNHAALAAAVVSGCGGRYPAGSRRAAGQYENSGSEHQPQASELCQQPNPQEKKTAGV